MKKIIALVLVLCLCLSLCTLMACGKKEETKEDTSEGGTIQDVANAPDVGDSFDIAYAAVTTSLAPFVVALSNAMQKMCDDNGWNLTQYDGEGNVTVQTEQIANIIADGEADLVIMFPVDSEVGATYANQLADAGIPLFTFVCDVAESAQNKVTHYIGMDHAGMAKASAQYAVDTFGADAGLKYVILSGWQAQLDYQLREAGTREVLDATNYEYLNTYYCGASRADAMEYAAQALTANPDLDMMVCLSDEFALGAVQAVKAAGREGEITITSIEIFQESIQEIKDGNMLCSITQLSSNIVPVLEETIKLWLAGEAGQYDYYANYEVVNAENADSITPEY